MRLFGVGKKMGVAISKFLLGAIDSIGPSNVLQVVTDNVARARNREGIQPYFLVPLLFAYLKSDF